MYEGLKQDPIGFGLDVAPIIGEIRSGMDAKKYSDMANEARATNNLDAAMMYEQLSTLATAGAVPLAGMASRAIRRMARTPQIDGPRIPGEEADELTGLNDPVDELAALDETPAQPGTAAQMLDDVAQIDNALRPTITTDIGDRRRVGTTGRYVGAPEGVNTQQKLGALTRTIKNLTKEGEFGKFWYERSGRQILDLTAGNKDEAEKIIQAIAITSARTPVASNFDFALQAYYQWKNGEPIRTGMFPTTMGEKLQKMFDGEEWAGRKTNNFYNNLIKYKIEII
jgi:hypothetical protein